MQSIPPRIVVHVFAQQTLSSKQIARARELVSESYESDGRQLVELIIDLGPPKKDPAQYESLQLIARGDADGIILLEYPLAMTPNHDGDLLHAQLQGPIIMLTAAELAQRGLVAKPKRQRKAKPTQRGKAAPSRRGSNTPRPQIRTSRHENTLRS